MEIKREMAAGTPMRSRLRLVLHPLTGASTFGWFPVFSFRGCVWDVGAGVTVWSPLLSASSGYPAAGSQGECHTLFRRALRTAPEWLHRCAPPLARAPIPSSRALDPCVTAHLPGCRRSSECQVVSPSGLDLQLLNN